MSEHHTYGNLNCIFGQSKKIYSHRHDTHGWFGFFTADFFCFDNFAFWSIRSQAWNARESDGPASAKTSQCRKSLTLVLGEQNKIYWYTGIANGKAEPTDFSSNGVRKILSDKKARIKNLHVLIKASDLSQYKNLIDVLDEMIIGGIERYAIVEMEKPDEELVRSANANIR